MSKQRDLRGPAAPAPAGGPARPRKRNAWWRRLDRGPRPITVVANDGRVYVGRRLPEAWVWVEAETAPGAANDPAWGKPGK